MSEPSPQCKRAFESFARTGGTFRFDPLEHAVRPGIGANSSAQTPKQSMVHAKQDVQKLIEKDKERREYDPRDRPAPWIPKTYVQGVPVALTTATAGNPETGLSQRFDTPPPGEKHGPPPSPRSPSGDVPLDELATSALQSDALVEAVTGPTTLAVIVEENDLVEGELKKRKLINDELEKQVARTKEIYANHKNICATMRAEIPMIQTQAQTDLQAVRDVVVKYDETVKELLMKKWRLDEMQRDEASPVAQPDAQPPLKLDALELRAPTDAAFEHEFPPMAFRGFTNNEHLHYPPMETEPSPFASFDRMQAIRRAVVRACDPGRGPRRPRRSSCPWARTSRTTRSAWRCPLRGGMYCSIPRWNRVRPTLSSFWVALNARRAQSSAAASRFDRRPEPNSCDDEMSAISIRVSCHGRS